MWFSPSILFSFCGAGNLLICSLKSSSLLFLGDAKLSNFFTFFFNFLLSFPCCPNICKFCLFYFSMKSSLLLFFTKNKLICEAVFWNHVFCFLLLVFCVIISYAEAEIILDPYSLCLTKSFFFFKIHFQVFRLVLEPSLRREKVDLESFIPGHEV